MFELRIDVKLHRCLCVTSASHDKCGSEREGTTLRRRRLS